MTNEIRELNLNELECVSGGAVTSTQQNLTYLTYISGDALAGALAGTLAGVGTKKGPSRKTA